MRDARYPQLLTREVLNIQHDIWEVHSILETNMVFHCFDPNILKLYGAISEHCAIPPHIVCIFIEY